MFYPVSMSAQVWSWLAPQWEWQAEEDLIDAFAEGWLVPADDAGAAPAAEDAALADAQGLAALAQDLAAAVDWVAEAMALPVPVPVPDDLPPVTQALPLAPAPVLPAPRAAPAAAAQRPKAPRTVPGKWVQVGVQLHSTLRFMVEPGMADEAARDDLRHVLDVDRWRRPGWVHRAGKP